MSALIHLRDNNIYDFYIALFEVNNPFEMGLMSKRDGVFIFGEGDNEFFCEFLAKKLNVSNIEKNLSYMYARVIMGCVEDSLSNKDNFKSFLDSWVLVSQYSDIIQRGLFRDYCLKMHSESADSANLDTSSDCFDTLCSRFFINHLLSTPLLLRELILELCDIPSALKYKLDLFIEEKNQSVDFSQMISDVLNKTTKDLIAVPKEFSSDNLISWSQRSKNNFDL